MSRQLESVLLEVMHRVSQLEQCQLVTRYDVLDVDDERLGIVLKIEMRTKYRSHEAAVYVNVTLAPCPASAVHNCL